MNISEGWPEDTLMESEGTNTIIELLNRLTLKIEKNQDIINRLVVDIDSDFELPNIPVSTSSKQFNEAKNNIDTYYIKEEVDILKKLLNSKYKLEDIEVTEDESEENPRIRELITDNKRLQIVHKRALKKNQEYLSIIKDYEALTIKEILPALRSDTYNYVYNSIFKDFKENILERKYESDKKLWDRYINYLNKLQTIYTLSSNLISILQKQFRDKEVQIICSKLVIIGELKDFLISRLPRDQIKNKYI